MQLVECFDKIYDPCMLTVVSSTVTHYIKAKEKAALYGEEN